MLTSDPWALTRFTRAVRHHHPVPPYGDDRSPSAARPARPAPPGLPRPAGFLARTPDELRVGAFLKAPIGTASAGVPTGPLVFTVERICTALRWHGALSLDAIDSPTDGPVAIDVNPRLVEPGHAAAVRRW